MRVPRSLPLWIAVFGLVGSTALAQVDPQTEDYEEQDRRYYERFLEEQEEESTETDPADVEAFLAKAEELVRDQNYWSHNSEHYRIQTDDPNLDSKAVADLLESFLSFFDGFWSGRIELTPHAGRLRIFLFDSFYKYNKLLGFDARYSPVRPKGHYISNVNVIALNTSADTPASLADSLVHEAAHQLVDQRLYGGSGKISPWVSEGLATYFGLTFRDKSGSFRPGEVGGKSVQVIRDAPKGGSREAASRLRRFRQALKSGYLAEGGLAVDTLVGIREPADFYGQDLEMHYTGSWLLVHFLLHWADGALVEPFVEYLELEKQGKGGRNNFYASIHMDAVVAEAAFREHIKKLKAR